MRKIKIFSWILSIITFLLVLLPIVPFSTVNSQSVYAVSENDGVDFRNGTIKYALTDTLRDVPNTFEAIVKIEKGQECDTSLGYIFSNMLTRVNLTYSVEVTAKGNPKLIWNSYEKQVVFDKVDLRNGEWTHIAIVRQKSQGGFVLYVNGMLVQQILCGVGDDIYDFSLRHVIGGDWNAGNAVHKPFMGKIRQVTLYNRELNESDVANDYNNSDKINYSSRTGLMFNAKLVKGEVAYDTSAYRNHAEMATNDYLYEGDLYEGHDYTIALMPDLQCITNHYESALKYPFDFLLDIKNTKNVKMVAALGDVTDGYSNNGGKWSNGSGSTAVSRDQYNLVGAQFERLGAAGIQNFAVPGNHDYDNECKSGVTQSGTDGPSDPNGIKGHAVSLFDKEFKDTTLSYFDSSQVVQFNKNSIVNTCFFTEYSGVKYMFFALDFGPSNEVIEWAAKLTEENPDRRVIVSTHCYTDANGKILERGLSPAPSTYSWNKDVYVNDPMDMWDKWLRKYPNVFMVFSGHIHSDEIVVEEMVGDHGNVVASFLIDSQTGVMNDALFGLVALFDFDESEGKAYINYYCGINKKLYNYQNQFVYDYSNNTTLLSSAYTPQTYSVNGKTLNNNFAKFLTLGGNVKPNISMVVTFSGVGIVAIGVVLLSLIKKGGVKDEK